MLKIFPKGRKKAKKRNNMLYDKRAPSLKDKIIAEEEARLAEEASDEETSEEETEEAKPVRRGRGKGRKNKVRK